MQLRFCLQHSPALQLYLAFAAKEFSVENIRFLQSVFEMRRKADAEPSPVIGKLAQIIYEQVPSHLFTTV
jgi:hypothetical protein